MGRSMGRTIFWLVTMLLTIMARLKNLPVAPVEVCLLEMFVD